MKRGVWHLECHRSEHTATIDLQIIYGISHVYARCSQIRGSLFFFSSCRAIREHAWNNEKSRHLGKNNGWDIGIATRDVLLQVKWSRCPWMPFLFPWKPSLLLWNNAYSKPGQHIWTDCFALIFIIRCQEIRVCFEEKFRSFSL